MKQERYPIDTGEDELAERDVDDAWNASPEERMQALLTLLDAAYQLWLSQGLTSDQGLCRFPGCAQERRSRS